VLGSGELAQSLMRQNLVDRYVPLVHPLVLGSGKRLFANGALRRASARQRQGDTHRRGGHHLRACPSDRELVLSAWTPVGQAEFHSLPR
jgi:dihydrofolate reductase